MTITLVCEIIGWIAVIGNLFTLQATGPWLGAAGAILLGLAYAGAYQ